ncbi:hypothetical protein [Acinetobacter sp. MD2(2019)]|uniref:hypothetical protein n=1 Tax=Acinetobacter sp. MD2(2019) TaxID=2605273 RepID=UPI002D1E5DFC|nr:hypothetical protein [Acinetobacter sp. MD2(2019)]MEB3752781.1 hypothetical protein [Acinetobacter sp. MD2(2019)]
MIEHQQQLLRSMGVELWAPRQAVVCSIVPKTIWRDQTTEEPNQAIMAQALEAQIEPVIQPKAKISERINPRPVQNTAPVVQPVEPLPETKVAEILAPVEFHLHVLVSEKFILITEQQQLAQSTQQLWRNIKTSLNLQVAELQWPFPLLDLQEPHALSDYVKGFLDVIAHEKPILSLGKLPFSIADVSTQILPSLDEMLAQPLKKRELWEKVSLLLK